MRKSLLPLSVAIVLGLIAAVFARNWMRDRIEAVEAEKRGGVQVVVAATEIAFGDRITAESVKTVGWPRESLPEGVFNDVAEVVGKAANQKIVAGEAILKARAIGQAGGSSLAALIEPNHRAVTVRVNDVIGVAGFLLPGNHVDVLATREVENRKHQTRTLLQDVKVLAVDQTAETEKDKPVVVRAITLEVDPRAAELLVQATEEGTVQMALRNPEETAPVQAAAVVDPPPADAPADAPVTAASAPRPRPRTRVVVVQSPASTPPPPTPGVTVIRQAQVGETPSN